MRRKSGKKWLATDRVWWALTALCVGVFFVYILFSSKGILHLRQLGQKSEGLQRANEKLQKENKELREKIERIKTDRSYREEIARRDLGLVRPNEVVYSFEGQKKDSKKKR